VVSKPVKSFMFFLNCVWVDGKLREELGRSKVWAQRVRGERMVELRSEDELERDIEEE
jgi:hypothetical protein